MQDKFCECTLNWQNHRARKKNGENKEMRKKIGKERGTEAKCEKKLKSRMMTK